MRKLITNLSIVLAMLIGLVATVPVAPALADCVDGDDNIITGNTIVCDADPGAENSDAQLDGGLGDDSLTVTEGVYVEWVEGDGADDDGGGDEPSIGDGGNDTIIMNGTTEGIGGDYVDGNGGDDTIIVGENGLVDGAKGGGIVGDDASGDGGNDTIIIDGIVIGDVVGDYVGGVGGNDTIEVNGVVIGVVVGDDSADAGGDDIITINGGLLGDIVGDYSQYEGGNDTITVSDSGFVYGDIYGDDVSAGQCQCVIAEGDGGDDLITVDGIVLGDIIGDYVAGNGGDDTITINGYVGGTVYGDQADWDDGNDIITINGHVDGDVLADTYYDGHRQGPGIACDLPCAPEGADDTVIIGAGGVSYGTACGDISVTNVTHSQGTVGGDIVGFDGTDSLVFGLVTNSQEEIDNLNNYLASLNPDADSATINGESYSFYLFETLRVQAVLYKDGPTRVYDDGMTLAFSTAGGVAVCHGPSGLRAASIDFNNVAEGQMQFGDNGFVVTLTPNGSGLYEAHVYKDGVEQINDANGDGVADSTFMFGLG